MSFTFDFDTKEARAIQQTLVSVIAQPTTPERIHDWDMLTALWNHKLLDMVEAFAGFSKWESEHGLTIEGLTSETIDSWAFVTSSITNEMSKGDFTYTFKGNSPVLGNVVARISLFDYLSPDIFAKFTTAFQRRCDKKEYRNLVDITGTFVC